MRKKEGSTKIMTKLFISATTDTDCVHTLNEHNFGIDAALLMTDTADVSGRYNAVEGESTYYIM